MKRTETDYYVVQNENSTAKRGAAKYIVGGSIVALGLILVTIAVCMDGWRLFTNFPQVTISPSGVHVFYDNEEDYSSGGTTIMESNEIRNIDVDVEYGEVIIQRGNVDKIDIKTTNIIEDRFKCTTDGDTLKVRYKKLFSFFNFTPWKNNKIVITLPENAEYDRLDVDNGAGAMRISGLEVKDVDIDNGAGELKLENLTVENKVTLKTGAGAVSIDTMSCDDLKIDSGVGEVAAINVKCGDIKTSSGIGEFRFEGEINGDADIDNGVGEIKMNLTGNSSDYSFKVDSGIGQVRVNGNTPVQTSGAKYTFKVSTGIGEVRIDFKGEN